MYLFQAFQFDVIKTSTTYTTHEIKRPLLHIQVIGGHYHITTMDDNINWMKLAHFCHFFPKLWEAFCTSTFTL